MADEQPEWWGLKRQTDYVRIEDGEYIAGPKTDAAKEGQTVDPKTGEQIKGQIRYNNRVRGFARANEIEDYDEAREQYADIRERLENADPGDEWRIRNEFSP